MPELASNAELLIDDNGFGTILVDGEEFPYHVGAADLVVEPVPEAEGMHTLRLGIMVEGPVRVNGDTVDEFEVR